MKTRIFPFIPLLLLIMLFPIDASAQMISDAKLEAGIDLLWTVVIICSLLLGLVFFVPGGKIIVGLIFSPLFIIMLLANELVDLLDKPERQKEKKKQADAESNIREALDDWLVEAIISTEIAVCADPQNAAKLEQLERLKIAKRQNNQRLIALHERFDTVEVNSDTVQFVKEGWASLKSANG